MPRREIQSVWITSVTNRGFEYLQNIVNNYKRQIYPKKSLCVILNSSLDLDEVKVFFADNELKDSTILSMPTATLGECLNRSIDVMPNEFNIWAKMDDDDFYGPRYILHNVIALVGQKAHIVGRRDMFVYVPERSKLLYLKNGGKNLWTNWVQGASLTIDKNVFKLVRFPFRNKGEDTGFLKKAKQKGLRIYATGISDYVVIRHVDSRYHTWKLDINKWYRNSIDLGIKKAINFRNIQLSDHYIS